MVDEGKLVEAVSKLSFNPGEVLIVRIPEETDKQDVAAIQDRILGCVSCLPAGKAPQGVVFIPTWVSLDQLQASSLNPSLAAAFGLAHAEQSQ